MPRVAYLGPEKTNTHFAAQKKFGAKSSYLHAPTVEDVFRMVKGKKAEFGVVPIENSLEGSVTHTLDRFADFAAIRVFGEVELPIQHYLITYPGIRPAKIERIFSHPQALAQCRAWLGRNCRHARLSETLSTADAMGKLIESPAAQTKMAAIGRKDLIGKRRLKATKIAIEGDNRTRFFVISLKNPPKARSNKTSLLVVLKDKPGALHDTLMPFKENKINLTKIESRPSKKKAWEYLFFIDLEGHESDPRVKKALAALRKSAASVRVLGSYPSC